MVDGLALQCCVGDAFQELLRVFNDILMSGIVPSEIKDATITPLLKNGAQNLPDNYRGLAVGNHIGKVLERRGSMSTMSNSIHTGYAVEQLMP